MDNVNQEVPPVPNQPPVKTANNLNFAKALAYGFVIVSIGISIAVGGYLLGASKSKPQPVAQISVTPSVTPTPDPTANWKTYVNAKYNFEFKYPFTWSSVESTAPKNLYLAFIELGPANSIQSGGVMAVTVRNQDESSYISALAKEGLEVLQRTDFLIGTTKASRYKLSKTLQSGEKSNEEIILALKNGILYEINSGSSLETYGSFFDQILSTFKFTP